jgi:hypothetical protein
MASSVNARERNMSTVTRDVTWPDGHTSTLTLGDTDSVVDTRWDILCQRATAREHGPITRATYYALGARAYADVIDGGWPVWKN